MISLLTGANDVRQTGTSWVVVRRNRKPCRQMHEAGAASRDASRIKRRSGRVQDFGPRAADDPSLFSTGSSWVPAPREAGGFGGHGTISCALTFRLLVPERLPRSDHVRSAFRLAFDFQSSSVPAAPSRSFRG